MRDLFSLIMILAGLFAIIALMTGQLNKSKRQTGKFGPFVSVTVLTIVAGFIIGDTTEGVFAVIELVPYAELFIGVLKGVFQKMDLQPVNFAMDTMKLLLQMLLFPVLRWFFILLVFEKKRSKKAIAVSFDNVNMLTFEGFVASIFGAVWALYAANLVTKMGIGTLTQLFGSQFVIVISFILLIVLIVSVWLSPILRPDRRPHRFFKRLVTPWDKFSGIHILVEILLRILLMVLFNFGLVIVFQSIV